MFSHHASEIELMEVDKPREEETTTTWIVWVAIRNMLNPIIVDGFQPRAMPRHFKHHHKVNQ